METQVWTAMTTYVLVAILKKRLALTLPLHTTLQILSVTLSEKVALPLLLTSFTPGTSGIEIANQMPLFDL